MDGTSWATLASGAMTAISTILAVYFTNNWTSERYEKNKKEQLKKEKMVILKPYLQFTNFYGIIDELIVSNIKDRVLLLSSEKDGFEFYDNRKKRGEENHRLLRVKNQSQNNIKSIAIDIKSKVITESQAVSEDTYTNFIQQLRPNEEFIIRVHNTEQRTKFWDELYNKRRVFTHFECTIYYLTEANEQICYEYEIKIESIPEEINEQTQITADFKIEILKDEYKIIKLKEITEKASPFRNIQDYILLDRVSYLHEKIGEAQAKGMISQASKFNNMGFPNTTTQQSVEENQSSPENK